MGYHSWRQVPNSCPTSSANCSICSSKVPRNSDPARCRGRKVCLSPVTVEARWSMYGIFTYIHPINDPNVGKYTIHGSSGEARSAVPVLWDQPSLEDFGVTGEKRLANGMAASPLSDLGPSTSSRIQRSNPNLDFWSSFLFNQLYSKKIVRYSQTWTCIHYVSYW